MARAANPNPARITDPLWNLWLAIDVLIAEARYGGSYAPKTGYHDTRAGNPRGNYSVQLTNDRRGPADKTAALDITFPSAQGGDFRNIAKYSRRLLNSGRDSGDERGNYLREFYGNADDDRVVEGWDYQYVTAATSDDSHLWHIHLSIMRAYLNDPKAMRAILSILAGETVAVWRRKEASITHSVLIGGQPERATIVSAGTGGDDMALSDAVYRRPSDKKIRTVGNILGSLDVLALRQQQSLDHISKYHGTALARIEKVLIEIRDALNRK